MKSRKIHQTIGLILVLPMIGWIITGLIFFIKPGYKEAYDQLAIKTYPLERTFQLPYSPQWKDVRLVRTTIGYHLLVKTNSKSLHLDPDTFAPRIASDNELIALMNDAFSKNKDRYGEVEALNEFKMKTTSDIDVTLNWDQLTLRQSGSDTELINTLYKIHYLQWTPFSNFNQFFGGFGLLLLLLLTVFGVKVYLSKPSRRK